MLARRLANSLAQSQHRGGEAGCCCLRFDPCSLTFKRNCCTQDGMFRRRGHFQQTFESGLPQSRPVHFQAIHDNATCVYMHIYIYSIYDEGNEALHSVGFQVHDGGSSVQDPRDTSRTLVAWQVGAANLVPRICTPRFIGLSIIPGYCRVPKVNQLCLCGDCWCIMVYLYGTIWQLWLLCALNHGVAIVKHDRTDSVPIAPSDWIL